MKIYVSGVNHKITSLEVRERFSLTGKQLDSALRSFIALENVLECVIISTCNRTEIYIFTEEGFHMELIEELLCEIKGLNIEENRKYFFNYQGLKAVRHIFKVAAGLDSLVLGEDQILGQVKQAMEAAIEAGTSGGVLNTLFRQAVTAAKEIKTNTELSKNSLSIASLAIKHVEGCYSSGLEGKTALIIGAGKMGTIALKNLLSKGIGRIYITKRSHGLTNQLAKGNERVLVVDYDNRYDVIDCCDIVISSTTSPHYTITVDRLRQVMSTEKKRVFVDLAVPRDLDPDVHKLENVTYFNLDDLQQVADKNANIRQMEIIKAEDIINNYIIEYEKWFEFRRVMPVVKEIQRFTDDILEEKIGLTISRLKSASEEDIETIKIFMKSIVKDIVGAFVYDIKDSMDTEEIRAYFKCLSNVLSSKKEEE